MNKFNNIKGRKYGNVNWHMTFDKKIPDDIKKILKIVTWSFVIVLNENDKITWLNKYSLNMKSKSISK